MTTRPQSQCTPSCVRYMSPFHPANTIGVIACAAFPGGIPGRIWNNQVDHRQPVDGDHGLQWLAAEGYEFPTYAFAPDALGQGVVVAADQPAEVHTGAMIALIPVNPDTLMLDGGEPATELHCTLLFLGEASDFTDTDRTDIVNIIKDVATDWGDITADAFAAAMFNPNGDEPCVVLLLSGVELADFHDAITDVYEPPEEQHQPWLPHITLAYTDDPARVADAVPLTGPIVFDRVRVAFGDQITDIPLAEEDMHVPDDDGVPQPETPPEGGAAAEPSGEIASARERWDGCPRCFGPVHDGPCNPSARLNRL